MILRESSSTSHSKRFGGTTRACQFFCVWGLEVGGVWGRGRSAGQSDSCASREPLSWAWPANEKPRGTPRGPLSSRACTPHRNPARFAGPGRPRTGNRAPVTSRCTRYVAMHPIRKGVMPTDRVHRLPQQAQLRAIALRSHIPRLFHEGHARGAAPVREQSTP